MTFVSFRLPRVVRDLLLVVVFGALAGQALVRTALLGWLDGFAGAVPPLHDSTPLRALSIGITAFGEESTLLVCFVGLIIYAYRTRGRWWGRFFTAVMIGALALDNLIKPLVGRARPEFEQLLPGRGQSFPSGHVLGTTALLFAIAYFSSRDKTSARSALWVIAGAGSILMGLSRVYLGVHWPTDAIAGVVMGACWTFLCIRSMRGSELEASPSYLVAPTHSERTLKRA